MSADGASRAAVRAAFADIDDASFWVMTKSSAAGPYGRTNTTTDTVPEGSGTPCHLTLIRNAPAKVMEKIADREAYYLHFTPPETGEEDLNFSETEGLVIVLSGGTHIKYAVIQAPARNPADTGVKTVRRKALIVRLEKQTL